ncbi:MAG: hypothetical protein ISEC1_P1512 [Thiomicrorhabdus sp.]|nr:MAG: hypothetical protein ISEC1_P1512 [Thiomicrorhabdus sp.]
MEIVYLSFYEWGWLGMVLIGFSLLVTVFYFRLQSKRLNQSLSKLYSLNQTINHDALAFFEQAWPILEAVDCVQMKAQIEWFGERKEVCYGLAKGIGDKQYSFNLERDDMRFDIQLLLTKRGSGIESISRLVVKTFIYILEQNLVLKQSEILTSQKRLERYQLFVQHEIKNIAQFILLLSEQIQGVEDDEAKLRLVNRLQDTLPLMAQRASKTVQQMVKPQLEFTGGESFSLVKLVSEVLKMYGLKAEMTGEAVVTLPRYAVLEILKNVLGNFEDHSGSFSELKIKIMVQDSLIQSVKINIVSSSEGVRTKMIPERLFEPFWTTSESGMGLGLFLARELLKELKGSIEFTQSQNEFSFGITLPCQID